MKLLLSTLTFLSIASLAIAATKNSYQNSLPIGHVEYASPAASGAQAPTPEGLYQSTCAACHQTGVLNAPKLGNKADWAPRITQGLNTLVASGIKGKNAMPPKGGANVSDEVFKATVEWMVGQSK